MHNNKRILMPETQDKTVMTTTSTTAENMTAAAASTTTITTTTPTLSNPILYIPKIMFLTKGKGLHKDYLTSFELALRDADIADVNLVSVSSIKPAQCKIVSRQEGRKYLMPGQIVFTVLARSSTNEPNRLIAASVNRRNSTKSRRLCRRYGYGNACYNTRFTK
jgi:hypothetical protein